MLALLATSALAACQPTAGDSNLSDNGTADAPAVENAAPAPAENGSADAPAAMPVPPASLPEPQGPIDPKSSEAAGQVVQHYGALIEQSRFAEAAALWGDAGQASAFAKQLQAYRSVHLTIGDLGEQEGAAGSIFITEPVTFYGETKDGKDYSRKAVVTLRRVNDVDGSTAAQRRWHIQSIDWS
jgi:hypothetical protein